MVVVGKVICRGQRLAVSAPQRDSAIAHLVDFTAGHAVALAAIDRNAVISKVAQSAVYNIIVASAGDPNASASCTFKRQTSNCNMRGVIQMDHRAFHY